MIDVLSNLKMVDRTLIVLHEAHEPSRLEKTKRSIQTEGVLRHPPVAVEMKNGQYLIIDGAHRTCSLQALGCSQIPLQIVNVEDVMVGNWDHVVPSGDLLAYLENNQQAFRVETVPLKEYALAKVQKGDVTYYVYPLSSEGQLDAWHQLVDVYQHQSRVTRVPAEIEIKLEPNMLRISYPTYTLQEIEEVVLQGKVMPAGVTRFEIQGRILNLQIPLSMLQNIETELEGWNLLLNSRRNLLRYYSKPVYVCET
ncbi:ParB N-terminal domain-containing protein [Bacillus changyiensis]|uniref:ParB N-terminal domain-containing protein n=1 Tax=Bacillus changyiensis TaxID=3004103 RepID=UPI0022E482B4|nr:ParB N-terminal domain-containing protein [Bacillus changyiensis]MDA1478081.1 ParB N-terminal domain-containing protein [Bacillus changyiensis]